ncbi:MAG: sugar phosphate isomerase/epimerase [Clostridia bacterium]|nr:sugar phosphate isomerase/epimerase [Clostridia bacterium]
MIRTGIQSYAYFRLDDYEVGMRKMKAHGYDCIDYQELMYADSPLFRLSDEAFEAYLTKVGACAQENGLQIWQLHAIWPTVDDTTDEGRKATIGYYKKDILGAKYLGCQRVVLHPCLPKGWGGDATEEEFFDANVAMLTALLPAAKEAGVTLCLENMPFKKGRAFSNIESLKAVIQAVNDECVKACLDTGHLYVMGDDIREAIVLLGNDLGALHVHDDLARQDRHLIPFQGAIDWNGFIDGLKTIRFTGCISLETVVAERMPEELKESFQLALSSVAKWLAKQVEN